MFEEVADVCAPAIGICLRRWQMCVLQQLAYV